MRREHNISILDLKILDALRELIGGDESALRELILTFMDEGDEIIMQLRTASDIKDLESLRRAAHSLKSSAQDFGASGLSRRCAMLESQCRNGWPEGTPEQIAAIDGAFREARARLETYLQNSLD